MDYERKGQEMLWYMNFKSAKIITWGWFVNE